jgi:hypothetical protein
MTPDVSRRGPCNRRMATRSLKKAAPYVIDLTMVDTDGSGTIDGNEFIAGCKNR